MGRLRAIGAIFGTTAALDIEQHRPLYLVRNVVAAMDELCLKQEIDERRAVNVADFLAGPVVLHRASLYLRDIGPPLRGPRMA
jgi:hypothetical protein